MNEKRRQQKKVEFDTHRVKHLLEAKRAKLLGNLPQQSQQPVANPDSGDLASRYNHMQRGSSLDQMLERHLAEIDSALKRVQDGTYGLCTRCGEPIAKARLEALPQTSLCLECSLRSNKGVS